MDHYYSVREWSTFVKSQNGKHQTLGWVAMPIKHDGKSYRRLMRSPNGPQVFAAWILIVQVAAKCPTPGILRDDDGPLTADDLEMKTDCPAEWFEEAFRLLTEPKIGWLARHALHETPEMEPDSTVPGGSLEADSTAPLATDRTNRTEQTEQTKQINGQSNKGSTKGGNAPSAPAASVSAPLSDQRRICFTEDQMHAATPLARKGFAMSGYRGNDGALIWKTAAAVTFGYLGEFVFIDGCNAAKANAGKNIMGFARTVMLEKATKQGVDLDRLLKQIKLPSGWSTGPPAQQPQRLLSENAFQVPPVRSMPAVRD